MLHSVCYVTREFPDLAHPLVRAEAKMLAEAGVSVHIITGNGQGAAVSVDEGDLTVHRLPEPPTNRHPEFDYIAAGLWSRAIGETFRELDRRIRFDLVRVTDTFAAMLHFDLYRRPETPVVGSLWHPDTILSAAPAARRGAGRTALHRMALTALENFDGVLAASSTVYAILQLPGADLPAVHLLPPPLRFDESDGRSSRQQPLELLFLGCLEPATRPELAIETLALARSRGIDGTLVIAGRDGFSATGRPYRDEVLEPLVDARGLRPYVRFETALNKDRVGQLLTEADCAICPGSEQPFHHEAALALAAGVPLVCGPTTTLVDGFDEAHGLAMCRLETFASEACDRLAQIESLRTAARKGAVRLRSEVAPATLQPRYLAALGGIADAARRQRRGPAPERARTAPLGIVVPASDVAGTRRTLLSIVAHTPGPVRLFVVTSDTRDAVAGHLDDLRENVSIVPCAADATPSMQRSAGLAAALADNRLGVIVVLEPGARLEAGWTRSSVERLETANDGRPAVIAAGPCLVLDPTVARQVGLFDPRLPLAWQDADYALRAQRLGHGATGVPHAEGLATDAAMGSGDIDPETRAYADQRWSMVRAGLPDARRVTVVALAREVVASPGLLHAYTAAVSADDDMTLVLYAPDADPAWVDAELMPVLQSAGVESDNSPDILVLPPGRGDWAAMLAAAAYARLSDAPATGPFAILPAFNAPTIGGLGNLLARDRAAA